MVSNRLVYMGTESSKGIKFRGGAEMIENKCARCGTCCEGFEVSYTPHDIQVKFDQAISEGNVRLAFEFFKLLWLWKFELSSDHFKVTCRALKKAVKNIPASCAIEAMKPEACKQYPYYENSEIKTGVPIGCVFAKLIKK